MTSSGGRPVYRARNAAHRVEKVGFRNGHSRKTHRSGPEISPLHLLVVEGGHIDHRGTRRPLTVRSPQSSRGHCMANRL